MFIGVALTMFEGITATTIVKFWDFVRVALEELLLPPLVPLTAGMMVPILMILPILEVASTSALRSAMPLTVLAEG